MPLGKIEMEQIAPKHWVAEIEAGVQGRTNLHAETLEEMIDTVYTKYREIVPKDPEPPPPIPDQPLIPVEMPISNVVSREQRNRGAVAADKQAAENKRVIAETRANQEAQELANAQAGRTQHKRPTRGTPDVGQDEPVELSAEEAE